MRVYATLIHAASGTQIWSNRYDMDDPDIFDLQDRIASDVASSLSLTLNDGNGVNQQQRDGRAFKLFAQARALFNTSREQEILESIDLYKQALEIEPDYLLALSGLIESYVILGFNYVNPSSIMADALDVVARAKPYTQSPEVQRSLGTFFLVTGDFAASREALVTAMALDPEDAAALYTYSGLLTYMDMPKEAERTMREARKLDPLSVESLSWMALQSYYWRDYALSLESADRVIAFDPSFPRIYLWRGSSFEMIGDHEQALADYEREIGVSTSAQALSIRPLVQLGQEDKARERLAFLESISEARFVDPFRMAQAYMGLGDLDQMFSYLEEARQRQSFHLITLNVEPMFDSIREDPRFIEIVNQAITH